MSAGDVVTYTALWAFLAVFVGGVFVFTFFGQTIFDGRRRRRARQTPEQIWRDLVAWKVWWLPAYATFGGVFFLSANTLGVLQHEPPRAGWLMIALAAVWVFGMVSGVRMITQAVRLGWRGAQDTYLGREALRLHRAAQAGAPTRVDAEAAS